MQPDEHVYSVITIDLLTRSSEIVDHARLVPDVVAALPHVHEPGFDERPQIVVLNKIDLQPEPPAFAVEDDRIIRVLRVSAATGAGIDELERSLFELVPLEEVAPAVEEGELVDFLGYRPQPTRRPYRVFRTERGFRVTGRPPDGDELERVLKAAGAREGDEVEVGEDQVARCAHLQRELVLAGLGIGLVP